MRQRLSLLLHALAIQGPHVGRVLQQVGLRRAAPVSGAPRLLFYAVNGTGLGHATRLLGIARQVRQQRRDAEILFLTSSEAAHLLYREGFAVVKTPSHDVADDGLLDQGLLLRLNHSTAWATILSFNPHCLIVDSFPSGIQDELPAFLNAARRKVFVFRAQRAEAAQNPDFQDILGRYDLILLPHSVGSETLPVPPSVATVWTGPMTAYGAEEMLPRAEARAALGLPPYGFIGLITLGGGGEPETQEARRQIAAALQQLETTSLWIEATGPLARVAKQGTARQDFGWRILREVHPLMLYMNAFDGAISAVGYNTTQEMQAAALPAILWPFPRKLDDQNARARQLAEAGRALCISEGAQTDRITELVSALRDLSNDSKREQMRAVMLAAVTPNGTVNGARAILDLLKQ